MIDWHLPLWGRVFHVVASLRMSTSSSPTSCRPFAASAQRPDVFWRTPAHAPICWHSSEGARIPGTDAGDPGDLWKGYGGIQGGSVRAPNVRYETLPLVTHNAGFCHLQHRFVASPRRSVDRSPCDSFARSSGVTSMRNSWNTCRVHICIRGERRTPKASITCVK